MKVLSAVMRTPKRKLAVAAAAVMVAGTGAAVAAEVSAADHSTEFNPVQACRIVDTRTGLGGKSGKFANGETHVYVVDTDAGGIGGCLSDASNGTSTSALVMSVTATQPQAAGFVRLWGGTDPEPNATLVNYPGASAGGFGATAPIKVADEGSSVTAGDPGTFNVKNYGGPTHIVIDVFGEFGTP